MQEEAAAQQEGEEGLPAMESSLAKLTAKREAYQAETVKLRVRCCSPQAVYPHEPAGVTPHPPLHRSLPLASLHAGRPRRGPRWA